MTGMNQAKTLTVADLNNTHLRVLLEHTRGVVEAAVKREPYEQTLPVELEEAHAHGLFVTLRRGNVLRSCYGRWGGVQKRVGFLLPAAAGDAACRDPRFPPIQLTELSHLSIDLSLIYDPMVVSAVGEERASAVQVGVHGLVITHPMGSGLLLPQVAVEAQWDAWTFLEHTARKAGLPPDVWWADPASRLITFRTRLVTDDPPGTPPRDALVRPAVFAGQFYPGEPEAMNRAVRTHLAAGGLGEGTSPRPYRGVMLPHAGWRFCGDTTGRTLARTQVPPTVIIVGPKHTPYGPTWSVAAEDRWSIPGAEVPVATDLAQRLVELVPSLHRESYAHLAEHGAEVLLPFLNYLRPGVRVLPIALGATRYATIRLLAEGLAALLGHVEPKPLLVISSDLNHFAPEPENRRLDQMALQAMTSGDPERLFQVCHENDISMCGLLPAVTVMQALRLSGSPLGVELVDYRNSAAVSGDTSSVVGYGGVVIG
jgi:hypothetical protein